MSKKFEIKGEDISDGYHTFDELYDHRNLLFIRYCNISSEQSYKVLEHFEGWFLLVLKTNHGQISYHIPNKWLHLVEGIDTIENDEHEWDGHTSDDVLDRLERLSL